MKTMAGMGSSREGLLAEAWVGSHGLEEAWTSTEEGVTRRWEGAAGRQEYQDTEVAGGRSNH